MKNIFVAIAVILILTSCEKGESNEPIIIKGSGEINDEIDAFRNLLGDPLNNTTGVTGGRREIDWDGVPDDLMGQALPNDFFNPVGPGAVVSRQRGLAYVSGGEFRVSNTGFSDLNDSGADQLIPFSGDKVFANISSIDWEIEFEEPGQHIGASVRGFGAVFTDVDKESSVFLEFFNGTKKLAKIFVPKKNDSSPHSFLGIYFSNGDVITRIRVHHGGRLIENEKDITDGGSADLIALDNFFYDEPIAR